MKIKFEINKYGYYNYKTNNDEGFDIPKCRICGEPMQMNKMKFDYAWMFCKNHEDEACIDYKNGNIEYFLDLDTLICIESNK